VEPLLSQPLAVQPLLSQRTTLSALLIIISFSHHIIASGSRNGIATHSKCLEASSYHHCLQCRLLSVEEAPQMSSSLTSGSLRFRTTSQHEPMRKPPQGAKTAVWMAGRTGWLIKHAWANLCHKKPKGKRKLLDSNHLLPSFYLTLKSRLNRDW